MKSLLFILLLIATYHASAQVQNGSYRKGCQVYNDDDYLTTNLDIQHNKWLFTHTAYEDINCEKPYLQYIKYTKVALNGQIANSINFTYEKVAYRPLTDETATALNLAYWCSKNNWQKDIETEVTGLTCGDFIPPQKGEVLYSIFKIEEKSLFLGQGSSDFNGSTESRRHQNFEELGYKPIRLGTSIIP